jgi:hypothetical protein
MTGVRAAYATALLTEPSSMAANPPRPFILRHSICRSCPVPLYDAVFQVRMQYAD